MNPRAKHLPDHWQKWVASHPQLSKGECTQEFNGKVKLKWEDGSKAKFKYAFCVVDDERKELLVLTEHCGYHLFKTTGLTWS
jgi:hypothetical protein